ncbi:MAG: sel1 repeat family protein [Endomicrobium sp.]|uniref:tetratricopeptide repeat protein n=1 Tax=Candidatus Endomicrobiellum pyrsonymphae TaxID=1408203 RepID=UPI00357DFFED|nr:sel1 repeat family protein [Endomicrobium sp.]
MGKYIILIFLILVPFGILIFEKCRTKQFFLFKQIRKVADQGDAWAQNNLGAMYDKGEGVQQNYNEALKWYRKAADQGHVEAQSKLEGIYRKN